MIQISGASDDVVSIEGDVNDEISSGQMITIGDANKGVKVTFKYAASKKSGSVWRASIEQIDEGIPMFPVIIDEAPAHGFPDPKSYSVLVTIPCPAGTPVIVGKKNLAAKDETP